jgi:hypothetical protein
MKSEEDCGSLCDLIESWTHTAKKLVLSEYCPRSVSTFVIRRAGWLHDSHATLNQELCRALATYQDCDQEWKCLAETFSETIRAEHLRQTFFQDFFELKKTGHCSFTVSRVEWAEHPQQSQGNIVLAHATSPNSEKVLE